MALGQCEPRALMIRAPLKLSMHEEYSVFPPLTDPAHSTYAHYSKLALATPILVENGLAEMRLRLMLTTSYLRQSPGTGNLASSERSPQTSRTTLLR